MINAHKLDLGRGWFRASGADGDVVISSRMRLGRNFDGHVFTDLLSNSDREALAGRLRAVVQGHSDTFSRLQLAHNDREILPVLLERGLLNSGGGSIDEVFVRADQGCVIIPFDREHLTLVGVRSGLELRSIHDDLSRLAGRIDGDLPFAVSLHWGYVAADPMQSGALLQASVLLHLPALVELGDPNAALQSVEGRGIRLARFHSAQANSLANVYQLETVAVPGASEEDITVQLEETVRGLVDYEREARLQLLQSRRQDTAESVERAIGLLRYTSAIAADEAMALLSWIRLGVALELTEEISMEEVTALLFVSQRCHLMHAVSACGTHAGDEDDRRAQLLRQRLAATS